MKVKEGRERKCMTNGLKLEENSKYWKRTKKREEKQ
jgi:hypothetical protein